MSLGWRHGIRVRGWQCYALHELTLLRLAWDNGECAGFGGLQRFITNIQPQPCLPVSSIWPVAVKAPVREQRAYMAIELYDLGALSRG
jgi:hypothetical protein